MEHYHSKKTYIFGAITVLFVFCVAGSVRAAGPEPWTVNSTGQWEKTEKMSSNLSFSKGCAEPTAEKAGFRSRVKSYGKKRRATQIIFEQSPVWDNWVRISDIEPQGGKDAPVFLVAGEGDYWYLNALRGGGRYSAWYSEDMKNWTLHKNAIGKDWVTTAEYADGTFYVYYDEPNDEDPHLVIDNDLTDTNHTDKGEVFADPSHGSDSGVFRAEDGSFHLIYEDWNPIDASAHSWDSPLAGHSESPDGIHGFEPHEHPAPIDERTVPVPEFGTFNHPAGKFVYHKHQGAQDAYGDYTVIRVGSQYYIFCDFDPHGAPMRLGYWTSDTLRGEFEWGGDIGKGFHPDPTIGFAEGQFYIFAQGPDFVSSGPWVNQVKARAGVDEDGDEKIDQWTDWQVVREEYSRREGFSRIVDASTASIDLSVLPAGYGFAFEFKTRDATENKAKPIMRRVSMSFE